MSREEQQDMASQASPSCASSAQTSAEPSGARQPLNARELLAADALRLWGPEAQINMMVEECAEFIQAVMHYRRGRITEEAVASEIADVRLMMEQARWVFGADLCDRVESEKRTRLFARLEVAEAKAHQAAARAKAEG